MTATPLRCGGRTVGRCTHRPELPERLAPRPHLHPRRPGASYGGFFWRAPPADEPPAVLTADADGEAAVHDRPVGWLALACRDWTLVLVGATDETRRDPWFVRTGEYPGVGSALAATRRLPLRPGEPVTRRIVTAVADGRLDRTAAATLAQRITEGGRP